MIHSILVGLDGSSQSQTATELGVCWAKRFGATLAGVAVVDEPAICQREMTGVGGSYYQSRIERIRLTHAQAETAQFVEAFAARCQLGQVRYTTQVRVGDPVDVLLTLHDDFDATLLAKDTRFRFATQDGPDDTLVEVLRQARRPVVAVPEVLPAGDAVMLAYDGSPAAADAMESFAASGLGAGAPVSVVAVADELDVASRRAEEATRFLTYHDIPARPQPMRASSGGEIGTLQAAAERMKARMVVMGAFSHGRTREWFYSSATTRMLHHENRVLYLQHHPDPAT